MHWIRNSTSFFFQMENDFIEEPFLADDDDEEVQIFYLIAILNFVSSSFSNHTAIQRSINMIN